MEAQIEGEEIHQVIAVPNSFGIALFGLRLANLVPHKNS